MSDNKQLINFLLPRHMNEPKDMRVCEKRVLTRTKEVTYSTNLQRTGE